MMRPDAKVEKVYLYPSRWTPNKQLGSTLLPNLSIAGSALDISSCHVIKTRKSLL